MPIATGRRDQWAVVVEATVGTLVACVAADIVRTLGGSANRAFQPIENLISEERKNTLGLDALIRYASAPGEFDFTTYLKLSGTAGTPIAAGYRACLKGTYGRETVTGGTSVVYEHLRIDTDTRLSYSMFKKFGATGSLMVLQLAGCFFNMMDVAIRKRGQESLLQCKFTGPFMRRYWAGYATCTTGSTTTAVILNAGQAKFFSAGAFITVTGVTPNPVQITSINYATDTLTVPTLSGAPGSGVVVQGWFPTAGADTAHIISGWRGVGTLGGVTFPHREIDYHLDNKIVVVDDIRNGSQYPSDYNEGEDWREVTMRVNHYLGSSLVGGMEAYYDADQEIQKAISIPVGDVAGRIATFAGPKLQNLDSPSEDTSGRITVERSYRLLETSTGNDESSLSLT